jgi:hypothetical protein
MPATKVTTIIDPPGTDAVASGCNFDQRHLSL